MRPTDEEIEAVNRRYYEESADAFMIHMGAQTEDGESMSEGDEIDDLFFQLMSMAQVSTHVLEIGSGPGGYAQSCPNYFGFAGYTGVEPSAAMIEIARSHSPDATFIQGNIHNLSGVLDQKYELFICTFVLPFLGRGRVPSALTSIRSVLTDEAAGIISLHAGDLEGWNRGSLPGEGDVYVVGWTRETIEPHLASAGFEVVREVLEEDKGYLWLLVQTI